MEVEIQDIAFGGAGVGRYEGKTVFVPFTIEGERVQAQETRSKKRYAEAELQQVLTPSKHRVEPPCPYFGRCGGCSYQHMRYEHQLAVKTRQVEQTLVRLGKLNDLPMRPMVASAREYGYRNRVTVHVEDDVIGFYRYDEHRLLDIARCPISREEVNAQLEQLRASRPREGHYTLRAETGPRVFQQVNNDVAAEMLRLVAGFLPVPCELLLDAYCGSGFFTRPFASRAARVIGIERDRFAVEAATRQAASNERYVLAEVGAELRGLLAQAPLEATALIADPPGTGLETPVRAAIREYPPATFIYVSCNPATLARDLAELQRTFSIFSVTPLDMFPQTAEIEVVVEMRPRKPLPAGTPPAN